MMPAEGERPKEEEGKMEWERDEEAEEEERGREGKTKDTNTKRQTENYTGTGEANPSMYYWCVAVRRKESSLALLILSTASFKSTKSTLHWQTLSTLLLARQRLE